MSTLHVRDKEVQRETHVEELEQSRTVGSASASVPACSWRCLSSHDGVNRANRPFPGHCGQRQSARLENSPSGSLSLARRIPLLARYRSQKGEQEGERESASFSLALCLLPPYGWLKKRERDSEREKEASSSSRSPSPSLLARSRSRSPKYPSLTRSLAIARSLVRVVRFILACTLRRRLAVSSLGPYGPRSEVLARDLRPLAAVHSHHP